MSTAIVQVLTSLILSIIFLNTSLAEPATKSDSNDKSGFIVLPFAIYSPETELAAVLTGVYHFRDQKADLDAPPSNLMLALSYSQKHQATVQLIPELYLKNGNYLINGELTYEDWPDEFYGVGNNSPEDAAENYTAINKLFTLSVQKQFATFWKFGVLFDYEKTDITQVETNGLLQTGSITGSEGGTVSGLGIIGSWDNRDDVFYPTKGNNLLVSITQYDKVIASDYRFTRYRFDGRTYMEISPSNILALNAFINMTRGTIPFRRLSLLGDIGEQNLMRGYLKGRFRDRDLLVLQAEYRSPFWRKFALVTFGGIGEVSHRITLLTFADLKWSGGIGLRFRASSKEAINLRFDYAVGENTSGAYFTMFEAF